VLHSRLTNNVTDTWISLNIEIESIESWYCE